MFTSRLPKSTSVRRPSNPNDGSTSIRNSNIPVSVRKANLFTPLPEKSYKSSLGNASTSRKSTYQSTSKPAPDQEEQARILRSLNEFIELNAPNFTLPNWANGKKFPSSVGSGDAREILQFLLGLLQENSEFKINKLEVDVPEVLADLEYPFLKSMTRSSLVSITNTLAVRNFFALCDWLIRQTKISYSPQDDLHQNYNNDPKNEVFQILLLNATNPDFDWQQECHSRQPKISIESYQKELFKLNCEKEQLQHKHESIEATVAEFKDLEQHEINIDAYCRDMSNRIVDKKAKIEELNKMSESEPIDELRRELEILNLKTIDLEEEAELEATTGHLNARICDHERQLASEDSENGKLEDQLKRERQEFDKLKNRQDAVLRSVAERVDKESDQFKKAKVADAESERLHLENMRALKDAKLQKSATIVKKEEIDHDRCMKIGQIIREDKAKIKAISMILRV